MRDTSKEFFLDDYDYHLPEELIAQSPPLRRGDSKLLVVSRQDSSVQHSAFAELLDHLSKKSLIVVNNSTVVPARIRARTETGSELEMLLLTPLDLLQQNLVKTASSCKVSATALLRPSKKFKEGKKINFGQLTVEVIEKQRFGHCQVILHWNGNSLESILNQAGEMPLPPYIRRKPDAGDSDRYQTIYADSAEKGSIAAPTAGLHFTREMRDKLLDAGHSWAEVTLYVGYGTFSPIREQDIRNHTMHSEYVKIDEHCVEMICKAKKDGNPVIAVGTTSMRTLEGIAAIKGRLEPFKGWLDTYIYPGFEFKIVEGLITNFHLPRSSLLVLVSAFAGRERMLAAYRKAVEARYKFFSYGDAMFIKP
nr:tRNA preQ1(34) S-adenosylmethionine ribosyltransferase-isomerase QueA [Desulfonatronum thiosulfatophilum]